MRPNVEESDLHMFQTEGFGGRYVPVRDNLTESQIAAIISKIHNSRKFLIGSLSHVVLRGNGTMVGYIGDESAQLCYPIGEDPENYKTPHARLRRIYNSV